MVNVISDKCYSCNKFNKKQNRQRNKIWCFCYCEHYTEALIKYNCKLLKININE